VSHRLKYNWKESGLIIRAPGGDRWLTTEALWLYVIKQAADDEYVGVEIQGQELLPVDVKPELATRVLTDTIPTPPNTHRQVTLSGNPVTDNTDMSAEELADAVRENQLKDPTRPDRREQAAQHPRQTRLQTVREHARSVWEFDTAHDGTAGGVVQPAGSVYQSATPPKQNQ
jgi:hypothetical protein